MAVGLVALVEHHGVGRDADAGNHDLDVLAGDAVHEIGLGLADGGVEVILGRVRRQGGKGPFVGQVRVDPHREAVRRRAGPMRSA